MMQKRQFVKNAAILTVTALILRTIGIFFRIYLSNRIGAEGIGLYQMIFSIYVLGSTFAASGITIAVTRLVADDLVSGTKRSVRRIMCCAVVLSAAVGLVSAALIFFGADFIGSYWLQDARAIPSLQVMSFCLPFMGVSSCVKGYFVARRKVGGPSRSQIFEQLLRIAVTLFLIDRFADQGLAVTCAAVMIGDAVSEIASCLYLAIGYLLDQRKLTIRAKTVIRQRHGLLYRLLAIAAPITAGRYLNSGLRTIENLLVPNCLSTYALSKEEGLSQFGKLKGMAMPLIFFPSSFLSAFSTLLVPEMSEALTLGQTGRVTRTVSQTIHLTLLSSLLIGGLFFLFADPLGQLIYHDSEVGFLLMVLAPLTPIMYLESVVDGVLKGLNQQVSSLRYSLLDSAVRIVLIVLLVPRFGMNGFLFIMVISNLLTCILNVRRLLRVAGMKLRWMPWVIKPTLAISTAGAAVRLLLNVTPLGTLSPLPLLCIGLPLCAGLYLLLLPLLGCVTRDDLRICRVVRRT